MARRGRKSRSKQRSKGAGSRSASAGSSKGGSRSSAGKSGGNKSGSGAKGGSKGKSTSAKTGKKKSTSPSKKSSSPARSNKGAPSPNKNRAAPPPKPKATPESTGRAPSKTPTKAQKIAKDRIASGKTISQVKSANTASMKAKAAERNTKFKQTGVQTLGGKKETFTKAEQKKITDAGYKVEGYSKAPAQSNTQLQINKDIAQYGNTVPEGSFAISEEGKALAAQQKAEAAAKKAEADKKAAAEAAAKKAAEEKARKAEEKRQIQFDPSRLLGGTVAQTGAAVADKVAKPTVMYQGNFAGRLPGLSNYFSPDAGAAATYSRSGALKGVPFAGGSPTGTLTKFNVPAGAQLGRSPLGIRQFKLTPSQMSQLGKGVTVAGDDVAKLAAKGLGKYGARAVPFAGAAISLADAGMRIRDKDYTGAALAAASAIPGPVGLAALGGLAFKDVRSAMNASQQVASTQAGGLNIGNTGGVDSGEAPSKTGRTLTDRAKRPGLDSVLGAADFALNDRTDLDRMGKGLFGKGLVMPSDVVKDAGMVAGKIRNNELSIGDVKSGYRDIKNIVTSKDRLKTIGDMNTKDLTRLATKGYDVARDSAVVQTAGEKLGLPSDFKQQTDTLRDAVKDRLSSVKIGDRDSTYKAISDFNRDIGTDPKLSLAARQAEAFRSGEGTTMQKIAAGYQPGAAKAKGLSAAERGIVGSVGNRIISGKQTDIAREAMSGMKAGSSLTAGNLTGIAQNVIKNTAPGADTKSARRASQIKSIVTGGRGRTDITPSSLLKGVNPFRGNNRGGGSTPIRSVAPAFTPTGGGTPVGQVPQIPATGTVPQFQVPELPIQQGTDPSNLANIQNESYQSTFKNLMAINPNYSARFQMRRRRGGRRGSFKRAFSRRFFS